MKLKEKSNHFNIYKNILNVSKFNKNHKFRSYFRYFLKHNLYNLIKKNLLVLLKFNNNLLSKNKLKFNSNNKFFNLRSNSIYSRTFNYIYIINKENSLNKKSKNYNKAQIKKIYVIKKNFFKRKKKKIKFKFLRFIKLLKNIKVNNIDFKYYKILFRMITVKKKMNKEILIKRINNLKFLSYSKFKKLNYLNLLNKKKILNLKFNIYNNLNLINLTKVKFNNIFYEDNKKKFKFMKYVKKNKKINKFKAILLKNICLINNIKNILNIKY